MQAEIVIRSQHVKKGKSGFGGPNGYIAVLWSDSDDVIFPKIFDTRICEKRNIHWRWIGECYLEHRGPRSAFHKFYKMAEKFVKRLEEREEFKKFDPCI